MQASTILAALAKYSIPFAQNAGASYIRSVPAASQIGITDGAASLNDGFPPLTFLPVGSGGTPPWGQDFNGLFNQITAWIRYSSQAGGLTTYDASFCTSIGGYPAGAVLLSSAFAANNQLMWLNTVDSNTTNPDGVGASGWVTWGPAAISTISPSALVHAGTDTSVSGNTVTVSSVSPTVASVTANMIFEITKGSAGNTGGVSATISGQSGTVLWPDGTALASGVWPASAKALLAWDGTYYRLMNVPAPSALASGGTSPTQASLVHYGVASGTNALTVTLSPVITSYDDGMFLEIIPAANNTGSVTINCNGLGAASTQFPDGTALTADALQAGQPALFMAKSGILILLNYGWYGSWAHSFTSNGYQKFPSGLIIQWGYVTSHYSSSTATFPIAFPNSCFSVTVGKPASSLYAGVSSGSASFNFAGDYNITIYKSSFLLTHPSDDFTTTVGDVYYCAIGY